MAIESAEVLLPSVDIAADLDFWTSSALGFRMDHVFPADDPRVACLSGHGLRLRLAKSPGGAPTSNPSTIRLLHSGKPPQQPSLVSPSGVHVEFHPSTLAFPSPPTQHSFSTRRLLDNAPWIIGRAGMHYRDLIPTRLGGSIIASHIRITDPGPVPDRVHFHTVGFQLIYVLKGWVRVVYEDQGPAFIMRGGDCVIQPPGIRHRVLESGEGVEVVEVGVPAEHLTTIDHEMVLPNGSEVVGEREWEGQRFVRSMADDAVWGDWRVEGFEARDTGVRVGTKGKASVNVVKPVMGMGKGGVVSIHDADILFDCECTRSLRDQRVSLLTRESSSCPVRIMYPPRPGQWPA